MLNGAREKVADVEVLRDLSGIDGLSLVGHGRIARDDHKVFVAREIGDDVFGHAVGEAARLFVAAQIVERQNRDRRRRQRGPAGAKEMPGAARDHDERRDPRSQKREP